MTISGTEPAPIPDPPARTLTLATASACDPRIMSIVAAVDAAMRRGAPDRLPPGISPPGISPADILPADILPGDILPGDILIEPLRQRLATLRPPRPLSFARLMFQPLDLLIVPATRWRRGRQAIPSKALMPMAGQVRLAMGAAAMAIEAGIAGRTTADTKLISRLGRSLWPQAAGIMADAPIPPTWDATELGEINYRPLAGAVAVLLAEAATLDTLGAEAATGLLPPSRDAIEALLRRVARANRPALPMMIAVLLDRLPEAAELLPAALARRDAAATPSALDNAAELLLRQLDQEDAVETRVAAGTLADAAAAVCRIATLLKHLDAANPSSARRDRVRAVRQRLDANCKARFASGLADQLLAPLQYPGIVPHPDDIPALEAAARGLRVLETEGRVIGGGSTYDMLLGKTVAAIKDGAMRDRLSRSDQLRLVEILSGPDAALAMLDQPPS